MTEESDQGQLMGNDSAGRLLATIHKRVVTLIERPWPDVLQEMGEELVPDP